MKISKKLRWARREDSNIFLKIQKKFWLILEPKIKF
jgi:hypothetical protein